MITNKGLLKRTAALFSYTGIFLSKGPGLLALMLAAALGFWFFAAARSQKTAAKDISDSLITINSYKAAQISAWRESHYRDAVLLSLHPFFGGIISEEISRPGSRRGQLNAWLNDRLIQKRDASLAFLTPNSAVIAATPRYFPGVEKDFTDAFALASQKGTPLMTDLYLAADGRPRLTIFSPISAAGGSGGKTLCVLVINIDPETEFYPLLKATPMFFETAETLLVRKDGGDVLYLNELDYSKDSALKLKRPLSDANLPAAKAVRDGYSGFFEGVDYRGVKVFSAVSHIEGSSWAVITKIDQATILAPFRTREHFVLALMILAAILIYGVFYAILRYREEAGQRLIRELEERTRAITDSAPDGILMMDPGGRVSYWNPAAERILGYEAGEAMGRDLHKLIAPERYHAAHYAAFPDFKRTGKGAAMGNMLEVGAARKSGEEIIISLSLSGVELRGEWHAIGIIRDITERKRTETYRALGGEILSILNEPGNSRDSIKRVLTAIKRGTGAEAAGIRLQVGEDFPYFTQEGFPDDFLPAENALTERDAGGAACRDKDGRVKLECACGLVISGNAGPADQFFTHGGSFWTNTAFPLPGLPAGQAPGYHPRGRCMHYGYASMALVPIRDSDRIVGMIQLNDRHKNFFTLERVELIEGIASHIGSALMRKRAEEALQETAETKSRFASMVSHELRSPLTAITLGVSFILESADCLSPEQKSLLGLVHDNTGRLGRLINDVLDLQKMAAGKMTFNMLENEISDAVLPTARSMGLLAKSKGLELITDITPGLPRARFDNDKITQVLTNLLANAIAHTEKGIITVRAAHDGGTLHISVGDTGRGIKAEDLPKLFRAFEQLGGGKTGGTGLGLAISKEIILAHNGKIWAESEPGKGSVFHFTLPVTQSGSFTAAPEADR